eukprot:PhM_4_TR1281/c1_g1_i2/m.7199/K10408/DNAH; dynein heavy chain, axonemal
MNHPTEPTPDPEVPSAHVTSVAQQQQHMMTMDSTGTGMHSHHGRGPANPSMGANRPRMFDNEAITAQRRSSANTPPVVPEKAVPRPPPKHPELKDGGKKHLYDFDVGTMYKHDVPGMRKPTAVSSSSVKVSVSTRNTQRQVVPLQLATTSAGATLGTMANTNTNSALVPTSMAMTATSLGKPMDADELLMLSIQHATAKRPKGALQETVAPNDEPEIRGLRNAEDTIAFFSKASADTAVKFVYLNRAPPQLRFRPYDLEVVMRGEQSPEHFVVSASGVVHMKPGQASEVVPLSDWMRESMIFNVLTRIRFFRNYLVLKTFSQWIRNVRFKLYCETRRKLCKKLFISKNTFAASTIELNKMAYELYTVPLLRFPEIKQDYNAEDFMAEQSKQRELGRSEFHVIMERMETRLQKLCDAVTTRAMVPDLTTMESLEQYLLANASANEGTKDKRAGKKTKSMVDAQAQQYRRMRELKRSMVEHSMLDAYIRLIDYIAAESLFRNALNAIETFYTTIRTAEEEKKKVCFQISITFHGDEELSFMPSEADMLKVYNELVEEILNVANAPPRLIKTLRAFSGQTGKTQAKSWNIGIELRKDHRVIQRRNDTCALFRNDFAAAVQKTKEYESNRQWFVFIEKLWPEEFERWKADNDALRPEDFRAVHQRLVSAQDSIKRIINNYIGFTLYLNSSKLKGRLLPELEKIQHEVNEILIQVGRKRATKLLQFFTSKNKLLQEKPTDLHRYAAFVQSLNDIHAQVPEIMTLSDELEMLYNLADNEGVEVPDNDKVTRDRVIGSAMQAESRGLCLKEQFLNAIVEAEEVQKNRYKRMNDDLDYQIERVNEECLQVIQSLNQEALISNVSVTEETPLHILVAIEENLKALEERKKTFTEFQRLFKVTPSEWGNYEQARALFDARQKVWKLRDEWEEAYNDWYTKPVEKLSGPKIEESVKEYLSRANRLNHDELAQSDVTKKLYERIAEEKTKYLPVILNLTNKYLKKEHWKKICETVKKAYSETITLEELWRAHIYEHAEVIQNQAHTASGEESLREQIDDIRNKWEATVFETKGYKESKDMWILEKLDDIIIPQLEDHQVRIQAIAANRYVAGVKDRVKDWDTKLRCVADTIDEWIVTQRSWMYLEFIFMSDDIKRQLPNEASKFEKVDRNFRELMRRTQQNPNVVTVCNTPGTLETLRENNRDLDDIQKRLEDYLETKRSAFPRFYFLSNDELLSILSNVRDPFKVVPYLPKCFDNMYGLTFDNEEGTSISAMKSGEGEEVSFDDAVRVEGAVENWLNKIQSTMKSSLWMHMRDTVEDYPDRKREEWFFEHPAQCVQAVDMVVWTNEVEEAIAGNGLPKYLERYKMQLMGTVDLVRQQLTKLQRTLVCTLIVVDVHNRDVVSRIIDSGVTHASDFDWSMQLRYYWEKDESRYNCGVHHCTARFWYGYEYLGNQPRLVITPLTDRAFLTCTSALGMNLGAAPQGPAGTGKTESVKDLGKALARQVVVFNCSDGLNYKMMSQMFAGLAQAGAWACFDEFNRIELEVLSVIAQQMLEIVTALSEGKEHMDFEGHAIRLSKDFGVFITMNPGYAGRTELPDNLKTLFRPMCMMIPDYALIAEIMFYSEGFREARSLAQKMVQLYKLSSEQLSKQDHYDFGMRAVKSILVMAGGLKRANPDDDENMLLIRAMRDANVPKFLRDDTVLFMALIRDLFPSVDIVEISNDALRKVICEDLVEHKLQVVDSFVMKILQLYDTIIVRHGVMAVGQTYCGKTTMTDCLARSLSAMHTSGADPEGTNPLYNVVHQHKLNPKSITMGEMYGEVNNLTKEWKEGILSCIARDVKEYSLSTANRHWIVFDGPVDAIWIENMNTVLDDNKMLCLNNGERIKLPNTATFMFEVQDLRVASPATVSRCGMVYMEPYYLEGGWRPISRSVAAQMEERHGKEFFNAATVVKHLDSAFQPLLDYLRQHCSEWIPTCDAQVVESLLFLLEAYVKAHELDDDEPPTVADDDAMKVDVTDADGKPADKLAEVPMKYGEMFDMYFTLSLIWSVGANVSDKHRDHFSKFATEHLHKICPKLPDDGIYNYCIHKKSMSFVNWDYKTPTFVYKRNVPYFELVVPTADTQRFKTMLSLLTSVGRHVLINGVTGVGKSVAVQDFLVTTLRADSPESSWEYFATVLSAQTSSNNLQERMESKLFRIRQTLLGASPGKRMIFFVDDLNMPALEKYGASPPIELIRQVISQNGMFDRVVKTNAQFKHIQDLIFLAACGEPGGGRNELTQRLTAHFHMLCFPNLTATSMKRIFNAILKGFLSIWPADIRKLAGNVVDATMSLYETISREKLPTPSKSHYTFNLRDFSKVVQGILQVTPASLPDRSTLIRLWSHEVSRVFHDRLVDQTDKDWWWDALSAAMQKYFGESWNEQFREVIFGDFMKRSDDKVYQEIPHMVLLQDRLKEYLTSYNIDNNKEVDLVFFSDAVQHLARVCRIIRQPRGNALLVGVGGSGRQSMTKLAAYMCGMKLFQIAITRAYGMNEFREDLKKMLLFAACENKPSVFLLSDSQICKEQMLEDINNILNTGEVPNLIQAEDIPNIITSMRKWRASKDDPTAVCIAHFVSMCRDNLKIVLTMSPVGDQFRVRLRMFPSLVNCCTIDWYMKWPADALLSVAKNVLDKVQFDSDDVCSAVSRMCVMIHQDVQDASVTFFEELRRHNYTTPTSYLELINCYTRMLEEQGLLLTQNAGRLQGGLDKLVSTQKMVDDMKEQLTKMQPVLEQSAKDTEASMKEVETEQAAAEVVKAKCQKEEAAAQVIKDECDAMKNDCQIELDKAMPSYNAAVSALQNLNKRDIDEVKAFTNPPTRVVDVLASVQLLLGQPPGWDNAKKMMSDMQFITKLREYDKDNIPEKTVKAIQKYVKDDNLAPDVVGKSSSAARSLCLWVRAIDNYYTVARTIEPKKRELAVAEGKLNVAKQSLSAAQATLKEVEDRVAALRRTMNENIQKKRSLEEEMHLTEVRLQRAEKLISGLAGEKVRWQETVARLGEDKKDLAGNMLLAAGFVAYLGPFTAPYRTRLIEKWTNKCQELRIPVNTKGFALNDIADPVAVRNWGIKGLPQDQFSIENAIIATRSKRWCLMIDPQGQANAWIKNMERENNLRVVKLSESNYIRNIEHAIRVGFPVLIENVEETLDASLDPLLNQQMYHHQGRTFIRLEQEIEYDKNFKLFITTKLPNPHYTPELQIKVTIVNFTVTQHGLEEQLLADVVRCDRADLEQKADRTVVEIADGKAQLKKVEDEILMLLASSSGNILDNEVLINALGEAKKTSEAVTKNLITAEQTQLEIQAAREKYRPVATRSAILYSVISEVSMIEHMYQYSLDFFKKLFGQTLRRTDKPDDVQERVDLLIPATTVDTYNTVCRGLFERDKQLFAFLMVTHIFRTTDSIKQDEWMYFLRGAAGQKAPTVDDGPDWLPENAWNELHFLGQVPMFDGIREDIYDNEEAWQAWYQTMNAYEIPFPGIATELNSWHKLLILRAMREDLIVYGMNMVIGEFLGQQFTQSPSFDLGAAYNDSSNSAPIIFVLTTGTDPTAIFTEFAEKKGWGDKKLMLSLGQDQGPKAAEMIATASKSGMWVYLQNCHVYASWMPTLERILEELSTQKDVHVDYRLWLTTMPEKAFPVPILQSGIKVTKEPPRGLKANLRDSFSMSMKEDMWESSKHPNAWKKLLFALTFFHGIIQERRKFGALGWNIAYEWNQSDLNASISSLKTYIDGFEEVQWKALRYMTGVINYGGRVTDFLDSRLLQTVLLRFFDPKLLEEELSITPDRVYRIPAMVGSLEGVQEYLTELPPYEKPAIYGLHSNADITFNRNTSRRQLDTVLSVQPRMVGGGGASLDQQVWEIAEDFLDRMPEAIDKEEASEESYRITDSGAMTSLGTILGQEVDVFNKILSRLVSNLRELKRAIKGEVVMSAALESMFSAFLVGKVPLMWHKGSFLSLKPLASWFDDFVKRIDFLRDWNNNGPPMSFWLPGFFFPQGFLTAALQTHSRLNKIPIDELCFRTHVTLNERQDDVDEGPETGVYVHGMFLEGARLDRDTNALSESNGGELFTSMPVLWLEPIMRNDADSEGQYGCPLYKTSTRVGELSTTGLSTNFVLSMDLPTGSMPPSHWIMRGVAMLCMLDD